MGQHYLRLAPLELFPSVSALWIFFLCGSGRTYRIYQGQRDGGCEQIANAHTPYSNEKSSRCGRGTRNDQLYFLGMLHVAPCCSNNMLHREGEGRMNEVPQKVGPQHPGRVHWSESATSEMFDPAEAPYS